MTYDECNLRAIPLLRDACYILKQQMSYVRLGIHRGTSADIGIAEMAAQPVF